MREARVRLPREVRSDLPPMLWDGRVLIAPPGEYSAHVNPHGAVAVILADGTLLGVKPEEFEWVDSAALAAIPGVAPR